MELSDRQLLLLDEFMYSDIAPKSGKNMTLQEITAQYTDATGNISAARVQDAVKNGDLRLSGDLSGHPERLVDVMQQIRSDPQMSSLRVASTTPEYEGSIRGACFVDSSGDATVAFRGTGGSYQQWSNNFEGYGDVSQSSERAAADFIRTLPYDNITVTGHSNGGNQAMYATIVCGDKIDRCVSYEGQGGSNEFLSAYEAQIAQNQGKIINICGQKDFVSPLLKDYAGKTVYVESDSSLLGGSLSHGGYGILTAGDKNGSFDENGNFKSDAFVRQFDAGRIIHEITSIMADHSNDPIIGPILELFTDVTGGIVGMVISEGTNMFNLFDSRVQQRYLKALRDLHNSLLDFGRDIRKDLGLLIFNGAEIILDYGRSIYDYFHSAAERFFGHGSGGGHAFGGGGSRSSGGGGNVIKVSTEDMAAAVSQYQTEKSRLCDALAVCNSAAQTLAHSWAGPSFMEMSVRLAATYKNLSQSLARMDDAIDELNKTIEIMERAEHAVQSAAASLDAGTSPFS